MIILRILSQSHPDIPLVWKLFSESFHEHERIILSELLDCPQATLYGIYPDEESHQFAGFFIVLDCERIVYLYYFAVCPEMRSTGIGGKALHTLIDMYNGRQITLSYESILQPSDNADQRKRRQAFYLRNGFHESPWYFCFDGTEYVLASTEEPIDIAGAKEMFYQFANFDSDFYTHNITEDK